MRRLTFLFILLFFAMAIIPQHAGAATAPEKVIFDTDIGDDIDDAYALALLLQSPQVKILGVTTAFGDTDLRARLVSRLLQDTGHSTVPVFAGPATQVKNAPSQAAWARAYPDKKYADAIPFILDTIRRNPGEITLICVAPLTNIGVLLQQDPATFRKLKRIVMMGGAVDRGYGTVGTPPAPEWNIVNDIPAAQALFKSGVPIYMMPLDSTQIQLDAAHRDKLFARQSALTDDLQALTAEWSAGTHKADPTLFDAVATAYALNPAICPTTPMHIDVDDQGMTRKVAGQVNAHVCLESSATAFFDYYLPKVMR